MASAVYCMFSGPHDVIHTYACVWLRLFRSGSRTDVPKRGGWSSWAHWAPGGTRFSGARGEWGRWVTGWSLGSSSPTDPSPTMEVWLLNIFFFDTLNFSLVLTDNVLAKHWIVKNLFCIICYFLLAGHFFLMFCLICHYPIAGELFRSMPLFKDNQWVESTLGLSTFNRLRCFHTILNVKWVHNVKNKMYEQAVKMM